MQPFLPILVPISSDREYQLGYLSGTYQMTNKDIIFHSSHMKVDINQKHTHRQTDQVLTDQSFVHDSELV